MALPSSFSLPSGGGQPIPEAVRSQMEAHFKADFSGVRVHVGPHVSALGALAFTVGDRIHFAPGHYQPDTARGKQLLGHELTHVVQQRSGRVINPFGSGIALVQDPALEAEAERMGLRAVTTCSGILHAGDPRYSVGPPSRSGVVGAAAQPAGSLQRAMDNGAKKVRDQAKFLHEVSAKIFSDTKGQNPTLMEVQSSILDEKFFIASNYRGGAGDAVLSSSYTFDNKKYSGKGIVHLSGKLHAEQQILKKLALLLASGKLPSGPVIIAGSKKPCSICRRVLVAFYRALASHYSGVKLHFFNQTGQTTEEAQVDYLELDSLVGNSTEEFKKFVKTYNEVLGSLKKQKFHDERSLKDGQRMGPPSLDSLTL